MRRIAIITTIVFAGSLAFAQKAPIKPKSKGEATAYNAMVQAPDPDARIKAADELLTKYADTEFKSIALYMEAEAYSMKGDNDKTIVYGEQALDADAASYQAAVLLAKTYANTTHVNDLDKAEKLGKIEKYGQLTLKSLETAVKPNAQLTEDQWTAAKNDMAGQAYYALGVGLTFANKLDDAKADFDKVATMDSDPIDLIRAARVLMEVKKWADAIVYLDKAANAPNAGDQAKRIAASDKARAQAMLPKK